MEKVAEATKVTKDLPHSNIFEKKTHILNIAVSVFKKIGDLINVHGNANERRLEYLTYILKVECLQRIEFGNFSV